MLQASFIATALLYGASCLLYTLFLLRGDKRVGRWAGISVLVAAGMHLVFLVGDYTSITSTTDNPVTDIHRVLSMLAWLIVLAFRLFTRSHVESTSNILGAFITPIALLMFLASGIGRSIEPVSSEVRSALLPVHIGVSVLGLSAFALAFGAAMAYILQERMLRKKQIGGIFHRLPSLDVLDSFGLRAVLAGFVPLTIGVITGAFFVVRMHGDALSFSAAQVFGLLTWFIFGGVLLLRVLAGWQGRRAAIGTIVGFVCAIAVLAGYLLRAQTPISTISTAANVWVHTSENIFESTSGGPR